MVLREPEGRAERALETVVFTTLCLGVALVGFKPLGNNDIGFHVRLGHEMLRSGFLPSGVDHLSYTADGAPYLDHEWLVQIAFAMLEDTGGVPLLVTVQGLLLAATFVGLYRALTGSVTVRSAIACTVLAVAATHFELRPHLVGWAFSVAYLHIERRARPLEMAALLALWANVHGGFVLGVLFACFTPCAEALRTRSVRPLRYATLFALAPLLNPFGWEIYAFGATIRRFTTFVGEWQPYEPTSPYLFVVAIGVALAARDAVRSRNLVDLGKVAVLALLAVTAMRNGIVALLYLAPAIERELVHLLEWAKPIGRAAAILALTAPTAALSVRCLVNDQAFRFELDGYSLPVAATEFLNANELPAPIFNDYNFGGYLAWKADRRYRLFVDGRLEIYGPTGVLEDYHELARWSSQAPALAMRHGIGTVIVRADRPVARALTDDPNFELVYFDSMAAIFVRRGSVPEVRRITNLTPDHVRRRERVDDSIADARYLLELNPATFGLHQVLAFQLARKGDYEGAREAMQTFFDVQPKGRTESADTRTMLARLRVRGLEVTR